MQALRRLVRFCLGVEALGLFGSISLFFSVLASLRSWAPGDDDASTGSPLLILAVPVLVILINAVPAVAWWTLRTAKRSARAWAVAASFVNLLILILGVRMSLLTGATNLLPVYGLCGAVGVLGLAAFWRKETALRPVLKKHIRHAGDGTSKPKEYLATGISIALIWLALQWENGWAAGHGLSFPSLLPFLIEMELALVLSALCHEVGHVAAGWASSMVLRSFQAGPFRFSLRGGKWRFQLQARKLYGGASGMVATDQKRLRSNLAVFVLGGPVASLAVGSACLIALLAAPGHGWQTYWMFWAMMANFSLTGFLANMIPQKAGGTYSDGAQLYQIAGDGPLARAHLALAMVGASLVTPLRPRDYDQAALGAAAESISEGERGLLLRLFSCQHYLDRGWIPEALACVAEAEPLYEHSTFYNPAEICAEFLFISAFYKRDLSSAGLWNERLESIPKLEKDAGYWRGRAALLLLNGDREAARDAWSKGFVLARDLPPCGAYDYMRSSFERLREALEHPDRLQALAAALETKVTAGAQK